VINLHLLRARFDYHNRAEREIASRAYLDYVRQHQLEMSRVFGFAGACAVLPICDCGKGRFDFLANAVPGFVCEAFAEDGETIIDLVAWPLDRPHHVLTMFGLAGLLGAWQAFGGATYFMGGVLRIHRTALDWLRSGCNGAAIVTKHVAAKQLLEVPGRIAAVDYAHGREIDRLIRSAVDFNKIVVPTRDA
jgi:hypothetical protein